jgi:hypothetical protein
MYCPGCGSEQHGQYCRSCGTDLRLFRNALERPDATVQVLGSARDEIGRAIADKIREVKSAKELSKVVEEVLPGVADFLETPEEKRLKRIRSGMIVAAIGLGSAVAFTSLGFAVKEEALLFVSGLGLTTFLIGLGLLFNGWLFTIPKNRESDQTSKQLVITVAESPPDPDAKVSPLNRMFPASVSEHTTHQLPDSKTGET